MDLKKYVEHNVVVQSKNRKVFRGEIDEYVFPEDNENGKESIILNPINGGNPIEFYDNDIKSIQIVN